MTFGNRLRFQRIAFGILAALLAVTLMPNTGTAQSGPSKSPAPQQKPATEKPQNGQKQIDELAEAAKVLGGTAGTPECVWLGRRIIILLWRDDLDTAFRHVDLYDRFNCPSAHIQASFRCLIKQGPIDPKAQETLNSRAFACWLRPDQAPPPAATATDNPAPTSAPTSR